MNSMTSVAKASKELFSRKADEIYPDMESIIAFLEQREAVTTEHAVEKILVEPVGEKIVLNVATNDDVFTDQEMTEWSFGHICRLANVPQRYINRLPSDLAATNINHGLTERFEDHNGVVMNKTGSVARAFYTPRYVRVPDLEVAKYVHEQATPKGYLPAGYFSGKRGGSAPVRPEASGLYASDRDLFMFMAQESTPFVVDGDEYFHCFIVWNSEVWGKTLGFMTCLYRYICGNHQIWGARDEIEVSTPHKGDPRTVLDALGKVLYGYEKYREQQQEVDTMRIQIAKMKEFADTKEKIEERLRTYIPQKQAEQAMRFLKDERAFPERQKSVFNVANAVTLYAQTLPFSEAHLDVDLAAGKIITDGVGF
jgi:hypothetical protein